MEHTTTITFQDQATQAAFEVWLQEHWSEFTSTQTTDNVTAEMQSENLSNGITLTGADVN